MTSTIALKDRDQTDLKLKALYDRAGADHQLSYQEATGLLIEGASGEQQEIVTQDDFKTLSLNVDLYKYLQEHHTSIASNALWRAACDTQTTYFKGDALGLSDDLFLGQPQFVSGEAKNKMQDSIIIPLKLSVNLVSFGELIIAKNPQDTKIRYQNGTEKTLQTLDAHEKTVVQNSLANANEVLATDRFTEVMKIQFRKVLIANSEVIIRNDNHGLYPEKPMSVDEIATITANPSGASQVYAQAISEESFAYHENWSNPFPIRIVSNKPFDTEQVLLLQNFLEALPEQLIRYYQAPNSLNPNESFSIALVTDAEFRKIRPNEQVMAAYLGHRKLLLLPEAVFTSKKTLESKDTFRHEFMHATFDRMLPDSLSLSAAGELLHQLNSLALTGASHFPEAWQPLAIKNGGSVIVGTGAAIGFGAANFYGKAAIRNPYMALGAVLLAGGITADYMTHFAADSEGYLAKEHQILRSRLTAEQTAYDLSVSPYAVLGDSTEFSAETLLAYLTPEKSVYETGIYSDDTLHGLKTREELMLKNPGVYLAYEVFFSEDSPQKNLPFIFIDEKLYSLIEASLALHKNPDGTYNLQAARRKLFADLPNLNPYTRGCQPH